MSDCNICCFPFTKYARKQIECSNCNFVCCSDCVRNYILSVSTEAKCMNCNMEIHIINLYRNFSKKFMVEYRHHRRDIMWNRELYHLPTISEYINWENKYLETKKMNEFYVQHITEITSDINFLRECWINDEISNVSHELKKIDRVINDIALGNIKHFPKSKFSSVEYWIREKQNQTNLLIELNEKKKKFRKNPQLLKKLRLEKNELISKRKEISQVQYRYSNILRLLKNDFINNTDNAELYINTDKENDKKRQESSFKHRPCITENCKGFLNKEGCCPLCKKTTCIECNTYKEESHICSEDDIETWNEMKKNTRPCPKCSVRIYKISGCDQMFCINCHTAFSWIKGTIETGAIHNPHYFENLFDNTNNQNNQNLVADNICNENTIPHQTQLTNFINSSTMEITEEESKKITEHYRLIIHIKHSEIPTHTITEQDMKLILFWTLYNHLKCDKSEDSKQTIKNYESNLARKERNDEICNILETYNRHQIYLIKNLFEKTITIEEYLSEHDKYRNLYLEIIHDYKKIFVCKRTIII